MESVKAGAVIDDMGEPLNNVEKTLTSLNIKLRDTAGSFRPMGEVLADIHEKWSKLNQVEQSEVANAIAGVRQRENFLVLMSNYNQVLDAQALAADSAGLAQQRYATYLNSTEAATNKMTAAWEKLVTDTMNSESVKTFIDFQTVLIKLVDGFGLLNTAIVVLSVVSAAKFLPLITELTSVIYYFAVSMGVAATAATALSIALSGGLVGIAIVGTIWALQNLNTSFDKTVENFNKASDQVQSNKKELASLSKEYDGLANKQNKNADDINRLVEIQSILSSKYGALGDGINVYTDAIDNNSDAIRKNIEWMQQKELQIAKDFLIEHKSEYDEAQKYLKDTSPKGVQNAYGGYDSTVQGTQLDLLNAYRKKVGETTGYEHDRYVELKKDLEDQIVLRQNLVNTYESYYAQTQKPAASDSSDIEERQFKKLFDTTTAITINVAEVQKAFDDLAKSIPSAVKQEQDLMASYKEFGQLSLDQVEQLKSTYGEEYVKAITLEGNQIKLNTEGLKELVLQRARDAMNTAKQLAEANPYNESLQQQLQLMTEIYVQVLNGSTLTTDKIKEEQKAKEDLLKITIDMLKQEKDAEKQALQDSLTAYKDMIDAKKTALENEADAEKQALQDQLDGYKKIIDAELALIDVKQKEADFNDKVAEKNKEISDIDTQLLALSFDNSEAAHAKRLELEAQKVAKTKELTKLQNDYTVNNQKDALNKELKDYEDTNKAKQTIIDRNLKSQKAALDQEYKDFEASVKAKIATIDEYLKSVGQINSDAMKLLSSKTDAFYKSLIEWNRKFGDGVDENIISKLNDAFDLALSLSSLGMGNYSPAGSGGQSSNDVGQQELNYNIDINGNGIIGRHSGGLVDEKAPNLGDTEVLAKLLKTEGVYNGNMATNFLRNTLPNLVSTLSGGNGNITIEMPINVEGNLDKSVLPELKELVLSTINTAMKDVGTRRNSFSYSV